MVTLVFNRSNRGRVAIFIDGSNLFYAALQLGIEIDYTKLLCYLTAGSRLLRAFSHRVDRTNESNKVFCSGCVVRYRSHQRVSPVLQMVLKVRFRRKSL